jgi:hypothetical protein
MLISNAEMAVLVIGGPAIALVAAIALPAVFSRSRQRREDAYRVLRLIMRTLRGPR